MIREQAAKSLKTVPREKAFYFFTSTGNYTGANASSLKEFAQRISEVSLKSLEFHLYRGDFEKWITEVLEDAELAREVGKLQRFDLTGDALRSQLSITVLRRLKQLEGF